MSQKLSRPLIDLLYEAPESVVFLVQDAIRAVAADDWFRASALMNFAAEAHNARDGWFDMAGTCSDELRAIAKAKTA